MPRFKTKDVTPVIPVTMQSINGDGKLVTVIEERY